jgi:hypothetical protein
MGGHGAPSPEGLSNDSNVKAHGMAQANSNGVQFGPVGRWWDDRSVVRTIGLSSEQKRKMDTVFDTNKPALLTAYRNYLEKQSKLTALSKDPNADKTTTFAAIDALSQARAQLQKTAAQIYIEIRQQMNTQQIEKLQQIQ